MMSKLRYNLIFWPTYILAGAFYVNGMDMYCLALIAGAVYTLVLRLRETAITAWWALIVVVPFGMFVLGLVTSFLEDGVNCKTFTEGGVSETPLK